MEENSKGFFFDHTFYFGIQPENIFDFDLALFEIFPYLVHKNQCLTLKMYFNRLNCG
jgi:hypothetical protein